MNTAQVLHHFRLIGATLRIRSAQPPADNRAFYWEPPTLATLEAPDDGEFILTVPDSQLENLEVSTLVLRESNDSAGGGSLALIVWGQTHTEIQRFLCGCGSEGWYAAPLHNAASTRRAA